MIRVTVLLATGASGGGLSTLHSAPGPWTTRSGSAQINLISGGGFFDVEGLVVDANGDAVEVSAGPMLEQSA